MTKQQLDLVMSILTPAVSYDAIKHVDIVSITYTDITLYVTFINTPGLLKKYFKF